MRSLAPLAALLPFALALPLAAQEATGGEALTRAALERAFPATVKVYGAGGFTGIPAYGSGVVIDERGFVLTAWSIALRTDELKVVTDEGRRYPAEVWRADPDLGAALLRIDGQEAAFRALRLADASDVEPGEPVLLLGNPFGIIYGDERPGVQRGVVSGWLEPGRRGERVVQLPRALERVLLTDIPHNPGCQGGPLVTLDGRLIGIAARLVESRATNTVLNAVIPSSALRAFVREGLAQRRARPPETPAPPPDAAPPPDLGVRLQRVHLIRSPLPYVERVVPGSAAARAGLRADDLLFRLGERTLRSCRDWDEALLELRPGASVPLTVKRGERMLRLELALATAPPAGEEGPR